MLGVVLKAIVMGLTIAFLALITVCSCSRNFRKEVKRWWQDSFYD